MMVNSDSETHNNSNQQTNNADASCTVQNNNHKGDSENNEVTMKQFMSDMSNDTTHTEDCFNNSTDSNSSFASAIDDASTPKPLSSDFPQQKQSLQELGFLAPASSSNCSSRLLSSSCRATPAFAATPYGLNPSQSQEPSQTQTTEILTQNVELTQLGDDADDPTGGLLSPLPPYSPGAALRIPWGRLLPSTNLSPQPRIELLPREPTAESRIVSPTTGGMSYLGLDNLHSSDIFNEYTLGRSNKCDLTITKSTDFSDKSEKIKQQWAFGMISNRHCRIFCTLDPKLIAAGSVGMEVYIEDTSGNGTVINNTTLLRRGEKRILHSGDSICLINPQTLRKKLRSHEINNVLQNFSFIFVNCVTPQVRTVPKSTFSKSILNSAVLAPKPPNSVGMHTTSSKKRKAAVDVRSTRHPRADQFRHDSHLLFPPPPNRSPKQIPTSPTKKSFDTSISKPQPRKQVRRVQEDYDIRDMLGRGTVGNVHRAIHRRTGIERAIKIIEIPGGGKRRANDAAMVGNSNTASAQFEVEASILQGLDHPYIVRLIDVYVSPVSVYLVMELVHGGDLFDRIVEKGRYSETESRRVMRRLLSAIHYLHEERNVVHRDLKPENILCVSRTNDVDVKITDFGLAKSLSGNEEGLRTFCGTPQYFAPEVLKRHYTVAGQGRYGKQADMWSLGVVLYVLLSGTPPFDAGMDSVANVKKIDFPDEYWEGVSAKAKDLVLRLLVKDPRERMTVAQACQHPWILTDDGDTHVDPLKDPKLSVSKKLLFPVSSGNYEQATCIPPGHPNHAVFKGSMIQEKLLIGSDDKEFTSAKYRATVLAVENSPLDKDENKNTLGVGAKEGGGCHSARKQPVACFESFSSIGDSENKSSSLKHIEDKEKELLKSPKPKESSQSNSEIRRPLSPVSVNECRYDSPLEESPVADRNLPLEIFPFSDSVSNHRDDTQNIGAVKNPFSPKLPAHNDSLKSQKITPGASDERDSKKTEEDQTIQRQLIGRMELSDDEVFSQFSEKTESISSFSTDPTFETCDSKSKIAEHTVESAALCEGNPSTIPRMEGKQNGITKKPKRKPSAANLGVSHDDASAKRARHHKQIGDRTIKSQPNQRSTTSSKGKSKDNTGRKQTTLSSFFKKHG